jgi:hypothetical protein
VSAMQAMGLLLRLAACSYRLDGAQSMREDAAVKWSLVLQGMEEDADPLRRAACGTGGPSHRPCAAVAGPHTGRVLQWRALT